MSFGGGPNPFRDVTSFAISLPKASEVSLKVYNVAGRHIGTLAEGQWAAGDHRVELRGDGLAPGMYFAVLRVNREVFRRTVVLAP